jgi:phage terminase Nu1 subunit (DNA packaging protein)
MSDDDDEFEFEIVDGRAKRAAPDTPLPGEDDGEDTGLNIQPVRGEIVTKTRLGAIIGKSQQTVEAWIKNGMPVIARGTKREGWKIDTASAIDWAIKYAVAQATQDPESMAMDAAKRRREAAMARIKELELERELTKTVYVDDVAKELTPKFGEFRTRALALKTLIPDMTPAQLAALTDGVNDMLADFTSRAFWVGRSADELGDSDEEASEPTEG